MRKITLQLFLACSAALLWATAALAQHTIYVEPQWLYNSASFSPVTAYKTSLDASWGDVQAEAGCRAGYCYTYSNLAVSPTAQLWDGIYSARYFDETQCDINNSCNTYPQWGALQTTLSCPPGSGSGYYNYPAANHLIACAVTIPDAQPPPGNCPSCLGNPIYAATGQKFQVETDYQGVTGLNFTRSYRSNNGYFATVITQAFVDNSTPGGTVSQQCYPSTWASGTQGGMACYPYISTYPYVNNGIAQYQLQTADGRSIPFSGPNNAVTANADVNERVTSITFNGATAWQVKRDDDSVEIYNAGGALIQKTLRGGKSLTYTYSTSSTPPNIAPHAGLLLTQTDQFGHTLSWQYNAAAQVTKMTDPAGGVFQYSYDTQGNLSGIIYPDTTTKTYWYNEPANTGGANLPNALTGITDESGVRYATFQYNSSGFAVNTQHAGGVESYSFNYTGTYQTIVTDPLGTNRTYNFRVPLSYKQDSSQVQPAASGSGTVTQSETYDNNGNPAALTDYNGNVTNYVYDLTRNLETSRTEAYGTAQARTITTQWNATWRQPALITEPNRTTSFTYDSLGNVLTKTITDTTVTPNVTRIWTFTYDSYGRMLTADGPRTDVTDQTTYTYYTCTTGYQCGQINTITNALGQVTTFNTYNAHGLPLTITDPNNVVTTLTYDARQRLTSRQVGMETTSYTYYPTGLLKLVTLPDSSTVLYTYDAAHRLTDVTDGLGNHTHYTLDAMGNRTAENTYDPSSALHRTHTRVINVLNQFYQDVNAAGTGAVTTTFGYDDNGNQTSIAAPLSRNTANQYDALNHLKQSTDPASGITQFGYDGNDNLIQVTDPRNLATTYQYTGFGDVKQLVSPDTGTTNNTYDSGGNLKTATDARSAVATYNYDALNRVTQVAYTDQTINFTYDAGTNGKGHLTGASDANHSLSWTYDSLGRVSGKGQTIGSVVKSVGYSYTNGDMTSVVTPSGQTITYGYTNHRVTSIVMGSTTILSAVNYDPFGPATGWTWGSSTTASRTYDTDGKVTTINTAADPINFGYDNAFRITGITDTLAGANSWTVGYDLLDRVTSASKTGTSYGWTYDADGNRKTQTGSSASTFNIASTSNRLSSTTGALARTYTYDTAGNTKTYSNLTFTYNNRGRESSVTVGSTTSSYVYSALGQMIKKTAGSTTTLLMYDEAGHLLGEYSSSGTLIQETVWMGDIPVATLRPNGSTGCTSTICIFYVHTDQLNAPRKVTRASDGMLAWRWDPNPFGVGTPNQNPATLGTFIYNLRFPGQYYQAETGLNYNYFRDYDPSTGRYIESDPIGLLGGINTYSYVDDDPISNSDPLGLFQYRKPNPNIGTIICNGAGGVAVQFPATINPKAEKCFGDCLRAHEVSHISDLRRLGPGLCKGQARGIIPTFDTTAQLLASERKSYDVELACLQKKLEGMSDCDECKKWIQTRIQTVTQAHP